MRRLLLIAAIPLAIGCRVPSIPVNPQPQEYAVYNAWIEQTSSTLPRDVDVAVDASTLTPQQNELQFQQCLPPRMERVFDTAPETTLTSSSSNDWLNLSDGRPTQLHPHDAPFTFPRSTALFRLSRVAFTRSGYQAYFWVEQRTCPATPDPNGCGSSSGTLIHATRSNSVWAFEETICHTIVFPT